MKIWNMRVYLGFNWIGDSSFVWVGVCGYTHTHTHTHRHPDNKYKENLDMKKK